MEDLSRWRCPSGQRSGDFVLVSDDPVSLTPGTDDGIVVAGGRSGAKKRSTFVSDDQMMLSAEAERFERRLTEEISGLRADLYREIQALRLEFHDGLAAVRQEMATLRADTLKWSFLFWIG